MRKRCLICIAVLFAVAGCVHYTIVPPAVDLTALKTLGLVDFRAENTKGDLYVMATQYFLQEVTAAQRVPVLELRLLEGVLDEIGKPALDRDAIPGEVLKNVLEHAKAREKIGWQPQVNIKDGIKQTYDHFVRLHARPQKIS